MKNIYEKIITNQILIAIMLLTLVFLLLVIPTFISGKYFDKHFQENILVEIHGMFFDLLIIGVFSTWLIEIGRKRIQKQLQEMQFQQLIKNYEDEIDDFRAWESDEASHRIRGIIFRLNKLGVKNFDLYRCYLKKAELRKADILNSCLIETNFEDANLTEANLSGSNFHKVNLQGANLTKANLQNGRLIEDSNLREAKIVESNLSNANLSNAILIEANIENSNFQNSRLINANLEEAMICTSNFNNTNFLKANLQGTKIFGSDFQNANLAEVNFQNATLGCKVVVRDRKMLDVQVSFKNANLYKANLQNVHISYEGDVSFEGAILCEANMLGIKNLNLNILSKVKTLFNAKLDSKLLKVIEQSFPALLQKPFGLDFFPDIEKNNS